MYGCLEQHRDVNPHRSESTFQQWCFPPPYESLDARDQLLCGSGPCGMTQWKEPSCNVASSSVTYLGKNHSDLRSPDLFPLNLLSWPPRHQPRQRRPKPRQRVGRVKGKKGGKARISAPVINHVLLSPVETLLFQDSPMAWRDMGC